MENKNYSQIRNRMNLIKKSLNEDLISKAALDGKLVAQELEGYLKSMIKDTKIADELTKAGIRTSEELLTALKGNRLTSTMKGALELSVLKSNTKNAKMIDLAAENLVRNGKFNQKHSEAFAKGQPAYEKALKDMGYSEDAITAIVQKKFNLPKSSLQPRWTPKPAPPKIKDLWKKWGNKIREKLKTKPNWKTLAIWGTATLGIGAAALWYMVDYFAPNEKPDGFPKTPPVDDTKWLPCILQLIKSKEGKVGVSPSGDISVVSKTSEFPKGLQYYPNGRVFNIATKDRGTYVCKNKKIKLEEVVSRVLRERLLNEQGTEISDETMDKYVDDAVDDLDGYVAGYNLTSLKNILTSLKGKTYKGENAIKKFLEFYKQDEGVNFVDDVKSVGVANLSVTAKNMKPEIIALASNTSGTTPAPDAGNSGIEITWDKNNKKDDKPVKTDDNLKKKEFKSQFHDCENKDFPLEFGCKSTKIAKVQKCLGVTDDGKFGKFTKKAMEDYKHDTSKGLTKDIYDNIIDNCGNKRNDVEPVIQSGGLKMSDLTPDYVSTGLSNTDFTKIIKNNQQPDMLYKALVEAGYIVGDIRPTTLDDGTIVPSTNRVKYKGPDLSEDLLGMLDSVMSSMGYDRIKQKLDKSYGDKYVWLKK
jgi:hypothetical protein